MSDQEAEDAIRNAFESLTARQMPVNTQMVRAYAASRITRKDHNGHVIGDPSGRIHEAITQMCGRGELMASDDPNIQWQLLTTPSGKADT